MSLRMPIRTASRDREGRCCAEVARYREELGVDHFIMRLQWPGLPQDRVLHSIRRLGEIFG
jgi:hypothetical protein